MYFCANPAAPRCSLREAGYSGEEQWIRLSAERQAKQEAEEARAATPPAPAPHMPGWMANALAGRRS